MSRIKQSSHVAILNNNNTEVLLTLRADMPLWVLPGGHREDDETTETAAIREVFEETGLHIKLSGLVAIYTSANLKKEKYLYRGEVVSGKETTSKETKEVRWFSVKSLPFNMLQFEKKRLNDAINYQGNILRDTYLISSKKEYKIFAKKPLFATKLMLSYVKSKVFFK